MSKDSTQPTLIEGVARNRAGAWQREQSFWSFGPTNQVVISSIDGVTRSQIDIKTANQDDYATIDPQRVSPPTVRAFGMETPSFGKRSFRVLSQWEGVVEKVTAKGFRARLVRLENGHTNASRAQFTDFSFGDLSTESDRPLILPGAVIYWTVGRRWNVAGTNTNESLVRIRRLPSPSGSALKQAAVEASAILGRIQSEPNGPGTAEA